MTLALGTMTWGRESDEAEARRMYSLARERGVRWFDSAASYSDGEAERILGRCIAADPRRDEVLISTKGGYRGEDILQEIEGSLKRLGVDWVAMYLHHHWMRHGHPMVWRDMVDLTDCGLAGDVGLSNCTAWQAADCRVHRKPRAVQINYSLAVRNAESELIPWARQHGVQVFAYSPLAAGLLACGKPKRLAEDARYARRFAGCGPASWCEYVLLASKLGQTPAQLAVAWVEAHPSGLVIPILGARNAGQLAELLDRKPITTEQWRAVASLFPPPQHPTGRPDDDEP